jgi:hypothetical protein
MELAAQRRGVRIQIYSEYRIEGEMPVAREQGIPKLVEGEDYYIENGLLVFTAAYHLKRGSCCGSGCRHCPYGDRVAAGKDEKQERKES